METCITSRDNPLIKRLKSLADSGRERREAQMTLLDGLHLIYAYLQAGGRPVTLLRAESCRVEVWASLTGRCPQAKQVSLPDGLFRELSPVETPVGVMAEVAWLYPIAQSENALVLLLEDIQDPGNLGSLLRSAAAAGATRALLSKGCADPWSPKSLRGGQGAQFVLPVQQRVDLLDWIQLNPMIAVIALTLNDSVSLYQVDLSGRVGILVGNEGAGLSESVRAAALYRVRIPMPGRAESLNVGAAAAIALFEAVRQRHPPHEP
ncbi:MAG: TrmH family RNA methyltransferase [Thiobacillaceae bacterium]